MIIKHVADVKPGTYAGTPEGVQVREMITGLDGAPNFSLRVFDVEPGVSTPFHSHEHEHEVFILEGSGTVRTEGNHTPFEPGDSVFIAPHEKHCFVAEGNTHVRFICVVPSKKQCNL